jgi:hypothetical protein
VLIIIIIIIIIVIIVIINGFTALFFVSWPLFQRLCGLVVRVSGYRSRGRGSISSAIRFSEKEWVWNGVHSAS